VDHLGVEDLLAVGQPGRGRRGQAGVDLKLCRRQAEQFVELDEVLADVTGGEREFRFGELRQHDGLAAPVDPPVEQRHDPVGGLDLLGAVARRS